MIEFLSSFIIHCISKDLSTLVKEEQPRDTVKDYLGDESVCKFIKKILKIFKALRVLEKNKSAKTPFFSKSIEKLVRFLSRKFPENLGLEGNLSEIAHFQNLSQSNDKSNQSVNSFKMSNNDLKEVQTISS